MSDSPPRPAPLRPAHVPPRRLIELAARIEGADVAGDAGTTVTGITHDSRDVQPGDLYVARAGERTHGIDHVAQALSAGASAVLTDPASRARALQAGAPSVLVAPDPRAVMGAAAAWVYGEPAAGLVLLGVTGTNGKTTTAYLLESGLRAAGHRTGLIGTVETRIGDEVVKSVRTTPEATDLQALFAVMRERGVTAAAMEVSSHALALGRVAGTRFDVAGFTNLSQDHLDFHADMEDYFAAKASLFTSAYSTRGVVCVDDEWGRRLATQSRVQVVTTSTTGQRATWQATDVTEGTDGTAFVARALDGTAVPVRIRLVGRFNVANALVALVTLQLAGVPLEAAVAGLAELPGVPGRLERVDAGQPFLAVVDYAHTPDAVATLLAALRPVTAGRLMIVLGCGGDRDRAKRPLMGAAAARGADLAVLTSDNPRSEDPVAILDSMAAGAREVAAGERAEVVVEADRRAAIALAVARAGAGDTVVVAGKGHEQGQEYADRVLPFDDRVVLRETIAGAGTAA